MHRMPAASPSGGIDSPDRGKHASGCQNLTTHQPDTTCQGREDGESLLTIDGAHDHRRHCGACRVVLVAHWTQRGAVANLHQSLRPRSEPAEPNQGAYHCRPSRMMMMAGSNSDLIHSMQPGHPDHTHPTRGWSCRSVPNQTSSALVTSKPFLTSTDLISPNRPQPNQHQGSGSLAVGENVAWLLAWQSMRSPSRLGFLELLGLLGGFWGFWGFAGDHRIGRAECFLSPSFRPI
jgi:hypothetical protein